jgi:hypothetical protein
MVEPDPGGPSSNCSCHHSVCASESQLISDQLSASPDLLLAIQILSEAETLCVGHSNPCFHSFQVASQHYTWGSRLSWGYQNLQIWRRDPVELGAGALAGPAGHLRGCKEADFGSWGKKLEMGIKCSWKQLPWKTVAG